MCVCVFDDHRGITTPSVHSGSVLEDRPRYFGFIHGVRSVFKEAGFSGLYRVLGFLLFY